MTCRPYIGENGVRGIMCSRGFKPRLPSDLPPAPRGPDLRPGFPLGQSVVHKTLGDGVITRRCQGNGLNDTAEITFEKHGVKSFCLAFAAINLKPKDAP